MLTEIEPKQTSYLATLEKNNLTTGPVAEPGCYFFEDRDQLSPEQMIEIHNAKTAGRVALNSIGVMLHGMAEFDPEKQQLLEFYGRFSKSLLSTVPLPEDVEKQKVKTDDIPVLVQSVECGNRALAQFVEANLPLVAWVSSHYNSGNLSLEEKISAGTMGLIEAAARYDIFRGITFATYASDLIKYAIISEREAFLANKGLKRHVQYTLSSMSRASQRFFAENGREPTNAELASFVGISEKRIATTRIRSGMLDVSLEETFVLRKNGESGEGNESRGPASQMLTPEEIALQTLAINELHGAKKELSAREKEILNLYYGEGKSFEEIGKVLEITGIRVYQLHNRIIEKLRVILGVSRKEKVESSDKQGIDPTTLSMTIREADVYKAMLEGKGNEDIAAQFGISAKTVEAHLSHVNKKNRIRFENTFHTSRKSVQICHVVNDVLDGRRVVDQIPDQVKISPREAEILGLFLNGLSNSEVASELSVEIKTVEAHLFHLKKKLGAESNRDIALVLAAYIKAGREVIVGNDQSHHWRD